MKIGLIDVDGHNFPNLALMKLSAWHKVCGDAVEWWWGWGRYDRVYMSKVFDQTYSPEIPEPLNTKEIIKINLFTRLTILNLRDFISTETG